MTMEQRSEDDVPIKVYQVSQILGGGCEFYWTGLVFIVVEPESGVATIVDQWSGVKSREYLP